MKNLHLKQIMKCIDGEKLQENGDFYVRYVITKPRIIRGGTVYFNLEGYPLHKIKQNKIYPNSAIVTDNYTKTDELDENITLIRVSNIEEAFWKFVEYYRGLFNIPVIGVTGTNGKTTTKEMIKHILSEKYKLNSTYRSKNSLSSNLKYLLQMDDSIEAGVFEMPVYEPGSLLKACRFLKPHVGIITNIGIDHIEGCKTQSSYIKAKAELLEGIDSDGAIILNNDDVNIKRIKLDNFRGKILYFGLSDKSDFRVLNINYSDRGTKFTFRYEGADYRGFIPAFGEFNVLNAIASIAAVNSIGIEIPFAIDRLKSFKNIEGHFQPHRGIKGSIIIDDTWNTNPSSAEAALNLFKQLSRNRKTITALGRMTLLGEYSDKYHKIIGKKVVQLGIDKLITMDNESRMIGIGAISGGMNPDDVYFCNSKEEVYSELNKMLSPDTIVLLKATLEDSYTDLIDKITID